jgi:hypothetical protein
MKSIRYVTVCCLLLVGLTAGCRESSPSTPSSPSRVVPANETERQVLELASQHVPPDWDTPIAIAPGDEEGTYVVTYWTPKDEIPLLGERQVIVNPATKTVEFVPRC